MCLTLREVQNPEKLPGLDEDPSLIYLTEVVSFTQPSIPDPLVCVVWCVQGPISTLGGFRKLSSAGSAKSMSRMISFYTFKIALTFCRRCCCVHMSLRWRH